MLTVNDNYPKNQQISDAELKELAIQNMQRQEIQSSGFPTETISLPSQGKVYSNTNLLSSGTIEMKYMTAREEDILTSQNLIKQGVVLDKLMQSLIVSPIKYNDLVIGDKNAIMIAARILGYGKEYPIDVTCPDCDEKTNVNIDLTQLPTKYIPNETVQVSPGIFEFTLPISKRIIHFKLLCHGDEKRIEYELEASKKNAKKDSIDKTLSTRLKNIIKSVDGNSDQSAINLFVENELFAQDSRALRTYIKEISPDQKFQIDFECSHCGHVQEAMDFGIDTNFFWPKS
jgi:rubredoxin